MKVVGIIFIIIGLFLGYSQFSKLFEMNALKSNTTVVEGVVVEVKSNLTEHQHWRNDEVELFVEFAFSPDSIARIAKHCLHHSPDEYSYLSCAEVGAKKMVRFIPKEKRDQSDDPDFVQVTDDGAYYSSTFAWYLLLMPIPFLFIGALFFWIGRKVK